MGIDVLLSAVVLATTAIGSYFGGKRQGKGSAVGIAVDTVELLQVQVAMLTQQNSEKDQLIAELRGRVEVLEGLVTQRAEVEAVHEEVKGVRVVVDRIAEAVLNDDA
jgi:hypothetical protein